MSPVKMLKRPFHDLIEIKRKVAKLEKSNSAKIDKKQRTSRTSSSTDEKPTGSQSKCVKRTEAPMPKTATSSKEEPKKTKSLAQSSSRRKSSEANASRDGNKEPKSLTGFGKISNRQRRQRTLPAKVTSLAPRKEKKRVKE